jgi:single-stranded DNA-binding protein
VFVGRLQQRAWIAEDGSARSTVEVVAEELGPSLRWTTATATPVRGTCQRRLTSMSQTSERGSPPLVMMFKL